MACGFTRHDAAAGGSNVRSTNSSPIAAIHSISSRTSLAGWFIDPINMSGSRLQSGSLFAFRSEPWPPIQQIDAALVEIGQLLPHCAGAEPDLLPEPVRQFLRLPRREPAEYRQRPCEQRRI